VGLVKFTRAEMVRDDSVVSMMLRLKTLGRSFSSIASPEPLPPCEMAVYTWLSYLLYFMNTGRRETDSLVVISLRMWITYVSPALRPPPGSF
jgi:hypothetical protein